MKAKSFIIKRLNILKKLINTILVIYEYDNEALTHVINVFPKEIHEKNKEYIAWELKTLCIFIRKFPNENIYFIGRDIKNN